VVDAALAAAGADPVDWQELPLGASAIEEHGSAIPEATMAALGALDGWLLGPHDSAAYPEPFRSQLNPSGALRKGFGLYANIRPARGFEGGRALAPDTDLVIVRENTEGFYADRNMEEGNAELRVTPEVVVSMRRITWGCCERIARSAFKLASRRRKKVAAVHKANVLRKGDGMFLEACRTVAQDFPEVTLDTVIVDAMAALVVRDPARFDVVVTTNMFGDILSDLTAELSGSIGLGGSINAGDRYAMAQAAHGSAPDIAGQDKANPISLILSAAMLLSWQAEKTGNNAFAGAAGAIEKAVSACVAAGEATRDVRGRLGTEAAGQAIAARVAGGA
jgi:3-isopropylmalate dehydrogenase